MKRPLSILLAVSLLFMSSGIFSLPVLATPLMNDVTNSKDNVIATPVDWSFVDIASDGTVTPMLFNDPINYKSQLDPYANIAADGTAHSAYANDIAIVYTAPSKVKIKLRIDYSVNAGSDDGVCMSSYINTIDKSFMPNRVLAPSEAGSPEYSGIVLDAGSKIYIRLSKNGSQAGDFMFAFHASVTYLEINPSAAESDPNILPIAGQTTKMTDNITASPKNWAFQAINLSTGAVQNMNYFDRPEYKAYGVTDKAPGDLGFDGYDGYALLYNHSGFGTAMDYDIASVFVAPVKAVVNVDVNLTINNGGDGVKLSVYKNTEDNIISAEELVAAGATRTLSLTNIFVNAGDKIFIRLNKNEIINSDSGGFGVTVTYADVNMPGVYAGEITNSKNNLIASPVDWSFVDIASDGAVTPMLFNDPINYKSQLDPYANIAADGTAHSAYANDIAIVYTAPVKAKIKLRIDYSVNPGSDDGVCMSSYINTLDKSFMPNRVLAPSEAGAPEYSGIVLDAGSKIYIRLNKNGSQAGDFMFAFHASVTYLEINPTATESNPSIVPIAGQTTKMIDNITASPKNWTFQAINLSTGAVQNMNYIDRPEYKAYAVTDKAPGDPEFDGFDGYALLYNYGNFGTSMNYDIAGVFVAPVKAVVNIDVNLSINIGGDGVKLSVYKNTEDNIISAEELVVAGATRTLKLTNIFVNAGDKIFIRLNKNDIINFDAGNFGVTVTYVDVNMPGLYAGETTNSKDNIIATPVDWSFVDIASDGTVTPMLFNDPINYKSQLDPYANIAADGSAHSAYDNDIALVYTAPVKAKIKLRIDYSVNPGSFDGVCMSSYINTPDKSFMPNKVFAPSEAGAPEFNGIVLDAGSKIYIRLNKNVGQAGDFMFAFHASVTYLEINPTALESNYWPSITFNSPLISSDNIISGLTKHTTKANFLQGVSLADKVTLQFLNKDNVQLNEPDYIGTNTKVKVLLFGREISSYTAILRGDINGDGNIGVEDLSLVKKQLLKISILEGIYKTAADYDANLTVSVGDLLKIKKQILELS